MGQGRFFEQIFDAASDNPDMEFAMIDATIVPVRRHGHGTKGDTKQAIGKSKGRLDDQNISSDGLIADKAFDCGWIIEELNEHGAKVVIS